MPKPASPPAISAPCDLLAWDSSHFGFPVARVVGDRLDEERAAAIDRWCREKAVGCLYFLADPGDAATARTAARHGYRAVDLRLTLLHGLEGLDAVSSNGSGAVGVRPGTEEDLPALRALAARSHRTTRFYHDESFPLNRCDELYAKWVEKGIRDPDQTVLVAASSRGIVGYEVIRHPGSDGTARLDLVAVADDQLRRGVGSALLLSSLRFAADRGGLEAIAVTQRRNLASIRVHERAGFTIQRSEIWYHRWFPGYRRKWSPYIARSSAAGSGRQAHQVL